MSVAAVSNAHDLHDRIGKAVHDGNVASYRLALLLGEMLAGRHHEELGYSSIYLYASQEHGLSRGKTGDLLAIAAKVDELPELRAACEAGQMCWTKARSVARAANRETAEAWVQRAQEVSVHELEDQARSTPDGEPPPEPGEHKAPARVRMVFEVDATDADVIRKALADLRSRGDDPKLTDGAALAGMAQRYLREPPAEGANDKPRYQMVLELCPSCNRVAGVENDVRDTVAAEAGCDAEVIDLRPGHEGERSRTIPARIRRAVIARDRGRCIVPGCRNHAWVDVHHGQEYAQGGPHARWNLFCLCTVHHRLTHEGLLATIPDGKGHVDIELACGRAWTVRLGGWGGSRAVSRERR